MSEENRMNEIDEEIKKNNTHNYHNKVRCFVFLYLLLDILEFISFEVLDRNDGNKWYYIAICLIFLSIFRIGKFLTSVYCVYFLLLQLLKIALKEQQGIEFIRQIIKYINKKN